MAVTQYIGARYVPLFADPIEWSNTTTYEPLTIVTHQGNSYTSRQFVPVGIDIANDEFWASTGNYNAQVEQYRQEVFNIKNALPIDSFGADNTIKNYIDGINTDLQADIEALENALPIDSFSADNTVKDYIDELAESIVDFDKGFIETDVGVDNYSKSAYTIMTLPRNKFNLSYAWRDTEFANMTLYNYVRNTDASIAMNGSLEGVAVNNGNVLVNTAYSDSQYWYILAFDANGNPHAVSDISRTKTGNQLVNSGYVCAFGVWSPVIENGVVFPWDSILPDSDANTDKDLLYLRKHTRAMFAWDNDNYYFITIDGRTVSSPGMTFTEMAYFCNEHGFTNCVNLDGGGSTQLWACGNPAINFVFPDGGSADTVFSSRSVPGLMLATIGE